MSKILQALERHNRMPDEVAADFFTHSLSKVGAANEAAQREAKNLAGQLAQMTTERDRLLLEVQRFAAVNTELGQLREKARTLEDSIKQKNAAILLEQSTLKQISSEANNTTATANLKIDALNLKLESLRGELSAEKVKGASLAGKLEAYKNRPVPKPAPIQHIMPPAPVDYSGLEFSVGNIVRGPDGIQKAQIKLVKAN